MIKTLLVTCSDDRARRKGGQYEATQIRMDRLLAPLLMTQRHYRIYDIINCDPLMEEIDPARNGRVYKPWCIQDALSKLEMGDFLIYNDCSPEMWPREIDLSRFNLDVIRHLTVMNQDVLAAFVKWDSRRILFPDLGIHVHELFTLDSCLQIMDAENYRYSFLCASGMLCFRKTPQTVDLVDEWLYFNRIPECACMNISEFEDHYWAMGPGRKLGNRHDQSILSILLNKRNFDYVDIVRNDLSPYNFLNFCIPGHEYEFIPSNRVIPHYRRETWTSIPPEDC